MTIGYYPRRDALMGWNGFALSMHMDSPIDPATGRPASGEVSVGFGR